MSVYLRAIGTANPEFKIDQKDVAVFMKKAHRLNEDESHDLDVLYRATGIKSRYTTIDDYNKLSGYNFFPDSATLEPFPDTDQRAKWYRRHALQISRKAINNCLKTNDLKSITHLICVSCTGMYTPGLDIDLVTTMKMSHQVERTAINFMGCYAAFNGLKIAKSICSGDPNAQVLLVCTELCSLHFQKEKNENNLLANALFGDGSAAAWISSTPGENWNLELDTFANDLLPNGSEDMTWSIGNFGFEMKLSGYVPELIKNGIQPLIDRLKEKLGHLDFDYYAIHPGGKKILSAMEKILGIPRSENQYAHEVLRDFGNMSSPTILFVLNELGKNLKRDDHGKQVLSFAFGPGLTLESGVMNIYFDHA